MIIFCGAGKIGRKNLCLWKKWGLQVDYFADNNPELWGKKVEGVDVISMEDLNKLPHKTDFYITCQSVDVMKEQLISLGIPQESIRDCSITMNVCGYAMQQPGFKEPIPIDEPIWEKGPARILFDFQNGMVLGGVESWSAQTAHKLKYLGWESFFLLSGTQINVVEKNISFWNVGKRIHVEYDNTMMANEILACLNRRIAQSGCRHIIINFPGYHLISACLVKRAYPDKVKVIAVVHNDEEIYYTYYKLFEKYIDKCLVISERIRAKMIKNGFPQAKLEYLPWEIACEEQFSHTYTSKREPLRIGYAGRIVTYQKRMDYLVEVIKRLKERKIDFKLEIAGNGSYKEQLEKEISENHLDREVQLLGVLDASEIREFWKRQDVMVSCSDWEGHSISQGEAMSAGAVPVVTDVSGAADDITDGENGFIVEVGSVEQIVEKICFLNSYRDKLAEMGEKAYQRIKEKNNGEVLENLWQTILH